jgi:hypothetical protein
VAHQPGHLVMVLADTWSPCYLWNIVTDSGMRSSLDMWAGYAAAKLSWPARGATRNSIGS